MAQITKADEKTFADLLQTHQHQISKALGNITGGALDKFLMSTMNLIRQNPNLTRCDQFSMLNAIRESATLGLSLDPNMGEASIVPFGKQNPVAKLIPGYRGLIKLATRSGQVSHMQARIFYKREYESGNFQYEEGTNASIHHLPMPPSERGDKMGVYSVANLSDGETSFDLMWKEDVEAIKNKAPGARSEESAWNTNPDEMWRKSVVRRHIKYLNISNEMGPAVATAVKDEYFDAGILPDVPLTAPKATKPIEEGEKVAEASDAPVQEKRGSNKVEPAKAAPKKQKVDDGNKDAGKRDGGKSDEPVPAVPERSVNKPPAEPEAELNPMEEALAQVKANIRELAENLGTVDDEPHKMQMEQCGDDIEKLNTYRLKLVRQLNEKMNS